MQVEKKIQYDNFGEEYLPFPWESMNDLAYGIHTSYMYVIAGEKRTAMAGDIAEFIADCGKKVTYIASGYFPYQIQGNERIRKKQTRSFEDVRYLMEAHPPEVLFVDCLRYFHLWNTDRKMMEPEELEEF